MRLKLTTLFILFGSITVSAQELLEMLKSDINTEKRSIVAEVINIPHDQETEFWRIYSEMEQETNVLADRRAANIKKFAENYANITDDIAIDLANTYIGMMTQRYKIYKKYLKKMSKVMPAKEAAKFIQLMGQIQLLIDVQIAAEVPLIE